MLNFKGYITELNTVPLKGGKKETDTEKARARQKQIKTDLRAKVDDQNEKSRDEIESARRSDFEKAQRDRERKRQNKKANERDGIHEVLEIGTDETTETYLDVIPCQSIKKV